MGRYPSRRELDEKHAAERAAQEREQERRVGAARAAEVNADLVAAFNKAVAAHLPVYPLCVGQREGDAGIPLDRIEFAGADLAHRAAEIGTLRALVNDLLGFVAIGVRPPAALTERAHAALTAPGYFPADAMDPNAMDCSCGGSCQGGDRLAVGQRCRMAGPR